MRAARSFLIVEPCQDLADMLEKRIRHFDFSVSVAHDVATVKELVRTQSFDVSLLDHDFLAADSLSLCAWLSLRNNSSHVLLLSNVVDSMLKLRSAACGVFACIPKQDWKRVLPEELDRVAAMSTGHTDRLDPMSISRIQQRDLITQ